MTKHAFNAEVSKVLHLMIHSLYTNKDFFLRELISNASDACDKLRYLAITQPELLKDDAELKIRISFDEKAKTLTVADNGIGMNEQDLITHLGTIAKSGTQEFAAALEKKDVPLIGQFGVGFYASYMVADKVRVESRKAGENTGYAWESDGMGEFTTAKLDGDVPRGTRVTLYLRDDEKKYLDKHTITHIVETYSDHIGVPIELDCERINTASALWMRPKSEITPEQYKEFYHHVAHSPDEPWATLHNKAEGKIEYTNLLFIPSMKPFDLYHPDRKRRVKLYVKRVYITDEGANLIPQYLRFLRGVIDSEDLPLNISRETLQNNAILDKIRDAVVKRVLGELKKRAEKDPKDYEAFWKNFGPVLKEGLCEALTDKELILDACRFHSTAGDGLTSLDAYISRMKPGQNEIYYVTGDNLDALKRSPQIEGFLKRGVEVLLFVDHVDDFWVSVVHQYKEKPLHSVTRSDVDLDKIEKKEEETKTPEENTKVDALIAAFKQILGDAVKDVRTTTKLADSPVCLAVDARGMDMRLERFLVENKQLPGISAKILEINPDHSVIQMLAQRFSTQGRDRELEDVSWLLLDQARIVEGEDIADPGAFSRRLSHFLSRSLAA